MAAPATRLYPDFKTSVGEGGALREFWIKVKGFVGSDTADAGIQGVVQNPLDMDLVILEAIINVTTESGDVAVDYDIGLGDDVDGSNNGGELADGMVAATLNTAGIKELGIVHAVDAPPVKPIWKAALAADTADSWIVGDQNGGVDAGTLRFDLYVKVIPYVDLA